MNKLLSYYGGGKLLGEGDEAVLEGGVLLVLGVGQVEVVEDQRVEEGED